jgi:hypothetical protein
MNGEVKHHWTMNTQEGIWDVHRESRKYEINMATRKHSGIKENRMSLQGL